MVSENVVSDKLKSKGVNDSLAKDISELFKTVFPNIRLWGKRDTDAAFTAFSKILLNGNLTPLGIFNELNAMKTNDMLTTTTWRLTPSLEKDMRQMADSIFARVQYYRIQAMQQAYSNKLTEHLKDSKEDVFTKLAELAKFKPGEGSDSEKINGVDKVNALIKAVKLQTGDKTSIGRAMTALGLNTADDKVNAIFAENQYNRVLAVRLKQEYPTLYEIISHSKDHMLSKLGGQNDPSGVDDLINAVKDANDKNTIESTMRDLGVAIPANDDCAKTLFGENQYRRLIALMDFEKNHSELYGLMLVADITPITEKLGAVADTAAVNDLLQAVKDADKSQIKEKIEALGLKAAEPAVLGKIFAENQYQRIQQLAVDHPVLHDLLTKSGQKDNIIKQLELVDNIAAVDSLLDVLKDGKSEKETIKDAMQKLGLECSDEHVKTLFAANQYKRILADNDIGIKLKEQLDAHASKTAVLAKLADQTKVEGVDRLIHAVKAKDKNAIKQAMTNLGLDVGDNNVNLLFAENQYRQILADINKASNPQLWAQLKNNASGVIDKLVAKNTQNLDAVNESLKALKKPDSNKAAIQVAVSELVELDETDNHAAANAIFSENQYNRILDTTKTTDPAIYKTLVLQREAVVDQLIIVANNMDQPTDVDFLLDAVKNPNVSKSVIEDAMKALGLQGALATEAKAIFAENQYKRLLANKDIGIKLKDQLGAHKTKVLEQLAKVDEVDHIDNLVNAVKTSTTKQGMTKAMTDLGLQGNNETKSNELFGENQYNRLTDAINSDEFKGNKHLLAYYNTPGKRDELVNRLGKMTGTQPAMDTSGKVADLLLGSPYDAIKRQQTLIESVERGAKSLIDLEKESPEGLDETYNVAFQRGPQKYAQKMHKSYQELNKNCLITIQQLQFNLNELDAMKEALQQSQPLITLDLDGKGQMEKNRASIQKQLDFYKGVQEKISKQMIPATNYAADDSKKYVYDPLAVTSHNVSRTAVSSTAFKSKENPGNTIVEFGEASKIDNFSLADKPKSDQVRCFDVSYDSGSGGKIEGRFTYDAHPPENQSSVVSVNNSTPSTRAKFEITTFPKKKPNMTEPEQRALIKARVEFAMTMATQILATLKEAPTQEKPIRLICAQGEDKAEEAKYLWTALVILGEKNPSMKFSPKAIALKNPTFSTKEEQGKWWGFAESSYKSSYFDRIPAIVTHAKSLASFTKAGLDAKKMTLDGKSIQDAQKCGIFKDKLTGMKLTEQRKNAETVVVDEKKKKEEEDAAALHQQPLP